jgi:hypothetical protein
MRIPRALKHGVFVLGLVALLVASGFLTVGSARAGAPTATAGPGAGQWPVALHEGTCAQPTAQPTDQLGNLAPVGGTTAATAEATMMATQGAVAVTKTPVLMVQKTIDTNIDDLINPSTPHALVLHESAISYTHYLACGELAGQPKTDDQVVVALQPLNGSDWTGVAILAGSKSVPVVGSNQTQVTIYQFQTSVAATGVPAAAATPAA